MSRKQLAAQKVQSYFAWDYFLHCVPIRKYSSQKYI